MARRYSARGAVVLGVLCAVIALVFHGCSDGGDKTFINSGNGLTISPTSGPITGGTFVTITGSGFIAGVGSPTLGGTAVTIGGAPATNVVVLSPSQLTAVTGPGTAGPATLVVSTNGQSTALTNAFTYIGLTISGVFPNAGSASGGDSVLITGSGFVSGATASFGGTAATNVQVLSSTLLSAVTPASAAGVVNVTVTAGGQTATLANGYTYGSTLTVASVSPQSGPANGGTTVLISGNDFAPGATVTFGGAAATNVQFLAPNALSAVTPGSVTVGLVNVTVTSGGRTSTLVNGFTYVTNVVAALGGPRQSSPIGLTGDDRFLLNCDSENNSVSIFDVTTATITKLADVPVGRDPSSIAVMPDGRRAYVANSRDNSVSVIDIPSRTVLKTFAVGTEPQALCLTPNGARLYVANAGSNNVHVIDTTSDAVAAVVSVDNVGRSPQAIAITNDGDPDDFDEIVWVGMFYGELRAGQTSLDEGEDDQREGRLAGMTVAGNVAFPFALAPMANTGFNANGQLAPAPGQVPSVASTNPQAFTTPTGAYVNQLAAIALRPGTSRGFVVSTGASPNGPLRFNHMVQGLVSGFNSSSGAENTAAQTDPTVRRTLPLNLNQGVNLSTTPAPRLFHSNPVAMAWRPNGTDAWVVIQNSNLVVRLTDDGTAPTIGAPLVAGPSQIVRVDLESVAVGQIAGKAPRGIVVNRSGTRAYVSNFVSRSVTSLDITNATSPTIEFTIQAGALPGAGTVAATSLRGAELFFAGRGPQDRMSSESWGGCITCHPRGLADGVTWMFDAGPRQTIPLDGMFAAGNPADQRLLNWSAVRDENHDFELNTRGVFGGRGLIDDDRLPLAIGGASGATPTESALIEQFQQFTGALTATNGLVTGTPALPTLAGLTPRRDFAVATLGDDRVFIFGGRSGAGQGSLVPAGDAVLELNPRTNTLVRRNATGFTVRHSIGAAAVKTSGGPRIYVVGGYTDTLAATNASAIVEEYNPATDTWRTVASLPGGVAQFGIAAAGGVNTAEPLQLIHVVSGNSGSEAAPASLLGANVQRFQADPAGPGTWSTFLVAGLTARRGHGAVAVQRGVSSRVFVFGGLDGAGTVLDTVDEYLAQAVTLVATVHTSMPGPRAFFGATAVGSTNQIYAMGGIDGAGADQTSVFEYTPANNGPVAGPTGTPSGTWVTRANLSVARSRLACSTPPPVTNLLPFRNTGRNADQDSIAVWIQQAVRPLRGNWPASDPAAVRGRALFGQVGFVVAGFSCATCHGGPKWTRSRVDYAFPPSPADNIGQGNENVIGAEVRKTATQPGTFPGVLINVGTFTLGGGRTNEVRFNAADVSQAVAPLGANGFNIPSLLSVSQTAPYYYNGLAQTLDQVLDGSQDGNGGVRHHFVTNAQDRSDLIRFLRTIDDTTPIFP